MRRRDALSALAAAALAGCGPAREEAGAPVALPDPSGAPEGSLAWAIAGPWRTEAEKARDAARHPLETLSFFGVRNDMTVLEAFPGRGWYTAILAPYLARGGGVLYAASFDPEIATEAQRATLAAFRQRFSSDPALFGDVRLTAASPRAPEMAPAESCDLALIFRNVHTLMATGAAERAFAQMFASLRPGGVLGVEQHRAPPGGVQDPRAADGYVQEAYVRRLAEEAGFGYEAASEINANPQDTRDHPFGVWTLPPTLRTAPLGRPDDPTFDTAPYRAIGESDRMTLKFRKPERRGR